MPRATVLGTGSYLPGPAITNEELARRFGALPEEVAAGLGVEARHWIADPATGEQAEGNTALAAAAALAALHDAGREASEVDLLIVSTSSPEYHLPATATAVADRLGLGDSALIDIRSGCAGALEALDVARLYIEAGRCRTAVVVGSEVISPLLVPIFRERDPETIRMRDRLLIYMFGDGAGAAVLGPSAGEAGVMECVLGSLGQGRKPGMQVVGAGTHAPIHVQLAAPRLVELKVDVVETGRMTPRLVNTALERLLEQSGVEPSAISLCVIPEGDPEQLAGELAEAGLVTPAWQAIGDRVFGTLRQVGATGSAALPITLDQAARAGRLRSGDLVALLAAETSKWLYGAMLVRWP